MNFLPGGNAFPFFCHLGNQRKHVNVDASKNGGTQQPWVFLLKRIILGCFGGTPIFGNTHVLYLPSSFLYDRTDSLLVHPLLKEVVFILRLVEQEIVNIDNLMIHDNNFKRLLELMTP